MLSDDPGHTHPQRERGTCERISSLTLRVGVGEIGVKEP